MVMVAGDDGNHALGAGREQDIQKALLLVSLPPESKEEGHLWGCTVPRRRD